VIHAQTRATMIVEEKGKWDGGGRKKEAAININHP
jgi:hypothetical protein